MIDLRSHLDQLNPIYAGGAAVLAALVLILARFGAPSKSKPTMTLTVKWGREKLRVPLPAPDTKLGTLRALLAEQTALPPSSFKLVHAGAVMKDDVAPLSAYGLRSGSKIALIDGAANAHTSGSNEKIESKAKPATEESTITVIRDELARVQDNLVPDLDVFLATISPTPPSSTSSAPDAAPATSPPSSTTTAPAPQPTVPPPSPSSLLPDIEMEHRRLGEEFLQALLRLDVLVLDGAWTSARTERKGAVKAVQSFLDRLDGGWRERKELIASQQVQ